MAFPLCDLFQITPDEIRRRAAFLRIGAEDEGHIAAVRALIREELDGIVGEFYAHLDGFPELAHLRADEGSRRRVEAMLRRHLSSLGEDADGLAYFEDRLRVGSVHEKVGLKQKWYLGSDAVLFEIIGRRIAGRESDEARRLAALFALKKILTTDAILAVETYHQAATERLEKILRQLAEAQSTLQELSRTDGLTQILNRRALMEALEMELYRAKRFRHPCTLLLVDIDHFKSINDRFGHPFGDFVLKRVVQHMKGVLRQSDIIGRYGGEEFAVGLVEVSGLIAHQIAERLRIKIALDPYQFEGQSTSVTVSIGQAELSGDEERIDTLLKRADEALYAAKAGGRNRVVEATRRSEG